MSLHHRSALALPLVALLTAACWSEAGPRQTRENAFVWKEPVPAGATLRVRNMNGEIEVAPSRDDTLRVAADLAWRRGDPDKEVALSATRDGDDALVCATWGKGTCTRDTYTSNWNFSRGATDASVHFRIEVPAGVRLELQGVNTGIRVAASAPVEARTLNGNVTVATAVGPVRGVSKNGSVDVRMSSFLNADSVIAETLNGDAFVYLPDGLDAALDLSVTNGSVASEFAVPITGSPSRRALRATVGAGSRVVRIRSVNGTVALRRLDAEGKSYRP